MNPITSHSELHELSLQVGGKAFRAAHENVFVVEVTDISCSEVALLFRTNECDLQIDSQRGYALEFLKLDSITTAVNAVIERSLIRAVLRLLDVARPAQKGRDTDARGDPDLLRRPHPIIEAAIRSLHLRTRSAPKLPMKGIGEVAQCLDR